MYAIRSYYASAERVILPDATGCLTYMLRSMTKIIGNLVVHPERMLKNMDLTRGMAYSGQLLLDLTRKGALREDAYRWIQRCAMKVCVITSYSIHYTKLYDSMEDIFVATIEKEEKREYES